MSAIDTNLPISQLDPIGGGGQQGTRGPYDAYVSPSMTPGRTSAYQKRKFHTQNLPDAFVDRALRIRDTTEEIAWLGQQKWQTSTVMPLRVVQDLVLHVEHFEAWPTFFSVTPEQAVAHMLTQSATQHEVKLLRWSCQARLEHGFMGTPIGQERYGAMLNQFATSMNETANAEVARALLDATDPQQTWLQRHGQVQLDELMNYMRWDLFCFGALQKNPDNPLEIINQRVNSMMKAYGGRADTIILSDDLETYAQLVPHDRTKYYLGGQEAVDRVNGKGAGVDRNTGGVFSQVDPVRWLGDNAIYIHRSMVVENQGDVDPWHRTRQIGEWNILEDTVRDAENYRTDRRTIFVYNQDKDTMSPLTIRDGILNCMLFDNQGNLKNLGGDTGNVSAMNNLDARFYPFAVETNSYSPIKYCGDLSSVHFDMGDVNKLTVTMIASAYRDAPASQNTEAPKVVALLEKAARSLRTDGRVLFRDLAPEDRTVFITFAERMRAIMPQSIFLDPKTAVYPPAERSAGATLWEALIYSNAYPIFSATSGSTDATSDDLLAILLTSLKSVIKEGALATLEAFNNATSTGSAEQKVKQAARVLRENAADTRMNQAELNAWVSEQVRMYRESSPASTKVVGSGADPVGFIAPGVTPPTGYVLGIRQSNGTFAAPSVSTTEFDSTGGTGLEEGDVVSEQDEQDVPAFNFQRGQDSGVQSESLMPNSVQAIHMFNQAINAGIGGGRRGQTSRRAERAPIGDRFGSMTEHIGTTMEDDQRLFETRFRERGTMSRAAQRLGLVGGSPAQIAASLGTLSANLRALADHGMPMFRKVMALIYFGMPFTRQTLLTMCDNDIVVPVTFLFVRPHITVESRIIVKCLSGGGSGYTYYAHANVMVGDNVLTGTHTINMHFYLRAHVHAPRNVFLIPDVYIMGYHGGMGVTPVTEPSEYQPNNQAPGAPCALFIMCSYKTTRETVPNPFDISGHFNSRYRIRGAPSVSRPAYDSAAFYVPYLALGGLDGNIDLPVLYEQHRNTLVYRGHQEEDDGRGGYTKIEPNTGHWGPKVYKGCKSVREGEYYVLKDVAYGRGTFAA